MMIKLNNQLDTKKDVIKIGTLVAAGVSFATCWMLTVFQFLSLYEEPHSTMKLISFIICFVMSLIDIAITMMIISNE